MNDSAYKRSINFWKYQITSTFSGSFRYSSEEEKEGRGEK
jgi:hypothetical protein